MDIRGIEVTNQLRSAIRAKLLELGVRYDEELPDYILVMVVNKKTRQQMHEDLHLFLEDSTTPFVEWLHDQVLKKLQKVTVAKKKATREFVPTVIVKQEEERKKRKNNASTIVEDPGASLTVEKVSSIVTKEEKCLSSKIIEKSSHVEESTDVRATNSSNVVSEIREMEKIDSSKLTTTTTTSETAKTTTTTTSPTIFQKPLEIENETKIVESRVKITTKRPAEPVVNDSERPDKRAKAPSIESTNLHDEKYVDEDEEDEEEEDDDEDTEENVARDNGRLKSCVNKPQITSVVSVKNRLGIVSPRKKFDNNSTRDTDNRHRQTERRFDKTVVVTNLYEKITFDGNRYEKKVFEPINRRATIQRGKNFNDDEISTFNRNNDLRDRRVTRVNDDRNRSINSRDNDRLTKNSDVNDATTNPRLKIVEKSGSTIKDRLGLNKNVAVASKQSSVEKFPTRNVRDTIKNRLGLIRNNFRSVSGGHVGFLPIKKKLSNDDKPDNANVDDEDDRLDDDESIVKVGPVKSHVIALKRTETVDRRSLKTIVDVTDDSQDVEIVDVGKSIASKVIVTPRPLKPLQPVQKRATQSLLLRAVAEANQSVVKQKNPEPVLSDKKPKLKRPQPPSSREIGKNFSVHLNAKKRMVMEKIQVQLRTTETEDNGKSKQYEPHPVNDEHMGVVMSLFQRSDDNQKFLVTLNGYNNNVVKEKSSSDGEDERLEMEVTEDDELVLANVKNVTQEQTVSSPKAAQSIEPEDSETCEKPMNFENNENHNTENVEETKDKDVVVQRKKRKLSPIVYNRTRSSSPGNRGTTMTISSGGVMDAVERRNVVEIALPATSDKSREKCRYWPNCTSGSKCAYYHPAVLCGAFPACKFGDKCVYKHPKCKFGLSCTKLGCVFSHPKQQCKYHPFCVKPKCPFSHPPVKSVVPTEVPRAKFTWKRRG